MTESITIAAVLCLAVVAAEWLGRHTPAKRLGSALLVILLVAVAANLGVVPAGSTAEAPVPVYDVVFSHLAPLAIFWLMLRVNLRDVPAAGPVMIATFLLGSLGTVLGVVAGMAAIDGAQVLGAHHGAIGGMFVGTYTGGSINFNAVALHYGVVSDGALFAGAVVVDNIMTTVWMIACIALPKLLARWWPEQARGAEEGPPEEPESPASHPDREAITPFDLSIMIAAGLGALWVSNQIAAWSKGAGFTAPSILVITALALALGQVPAVARLRGAQVLGMFAVYVFLGTIGAFCDVGALARLGALGPQLLAFAFVVVAIHGLVCFGGARLLRVDLTVASVASQANVGGGTTALALARSLGRHDLVLPGLLMGALGNAVGTFLGFFVAAQLS